MKIYRKQFYESPLSKFRFCGLARDTSILLTKDDFGEIEEYFKCEYPKGVDEKTINDFFAYEAEEVARILGFDDWSALEEERTK